MSEPIEILFCGDSLQELKHLPDNSVDSVVTDPPYGIAFMGKKWDYDVPSTDLWKEVLRVLKPGGHLLSFGGTRTYHRMVVAIEDAGFEIRDQIQWIYGSGFPKSHNLEGAFEGWGTALKPANEPIVLARKPLESKHTVASNVEKHGTGAINIEASRVGELNEQRRWPANLLLDEGAAETLDLQQNGVSRFFYVAKASKSERNAGLEGMPLKAAGKHQSSFEGGKMLTGSGNERSNSSQNNHPTVKPIALMQYLIKMITPANGTVLDPFMGSGTTGIAAKNLGFNFVGIEREQAYYEIAERRIMKARGVA